MGGARPAKDSMRKGRSPNVNRSILGPKGSIVLICSHTIAFIGYGRQGLELLIAPARQGPGGNGAHASQP